MSGSGTWRYPTQTNIAYIICHTSIGSEISVDSLAIYGNICECVGLGIIITYRRTTALMPIVKAASGGIPTKIYSTLLILSGIVVLGKLVTMFIPMIPRTRPTSWYIRGFRTDFSFTDLFSTNPYLTFTTLLGGALLNTGRWEPRLFMVGHLKFPRKVTGAGRSRKAGRIG